MEINSLDDQVACALQVLQDAQLQILNLRSLIQRNNMNVDNSSYNNHLNNSNSDDALDIPEIPDTKVDEEVKREEVKHEQEETIPSTNSDAIRQRRLLRFSNPNVNN